MIQGFCRTNLDDCKKWTWPQVFVAVPEIGSYVKALEKGAGTHLKVCGVTYYVAKVYTSNGESGCHTDQHGLYNLEPRIEVELNK